MAMKIPARYEPCASKPPTIAPDTSAWLCCRYEDVGGGRCLLGDPVGLVVTMKPVARLSLAPLGPFTLSNSGAKTFTAKFSLTTFRPGDVVAFAVNCQSGASTPNGNKCGEIIDNGFAQCDTSPGETILLFALCR